MTKSGKLSRRSSLKVFDNPLFEKSNSQESALRRLSGSNASKIARKLVQPRSINKKTAFEFPAHVQKRLKSFEKGKPLSIRIKKQLLQTLENKPTKPKRSIGARISSMFMRKKTNMLYSVRNYQGIRSSLSGIKKSLNKSYIACLSPKSSSFKYVNRELKTLQKLLKQQDEQPDLHLDPMIKIQAKKVLNSNWVRSHTVDDDGTVVSKRTHLNKSVNVLKELVGELDVSEMPLDDIDSLELRAPSVEEREGWEEAFGYEIDDLERLCINFKPKFCYDESFKVDGENVVPIELADSTTYAPLKLALQVDQKLNRLNERLMGGRSQFNRAIKQYSDASNQSADRFKLKSAIGFQRVLVVADSLKKSGKIKTQAQFDSFIQKGKEAIDNSMNSKSKALSTINSNIDLAAETQLSPFELSLVNKAVINVFSDLLTQEETAAMSKVLHSQKPPLVSIHKAGYGVPFLSVFNKMGYVSSADMQKVKHSSGRGIKAVAIKTKSQVQTTRSGKEIVKYLSKNVSAIVNSSSESGVIEAGSDLAEFLNSANVVLNTASMVGNAMGAVSQGVFLKMYVDSSDRLFSKATELEKKMGDLLKKKDEASQTGQDVSLQEDEISLLSREIKSLFKLADLADNKVLTKGARTALNIAALCLKTNVATMGIALGLDIANLMVSAVAETKIEQAQTDTFRYESQDQMALMRPIFREKPTVSDIHSNLFGGNSYVNCKLTMALEEILGLDTQGDGEFFEMVQNPLIAHAETSILDATKQ